MTTAPLKSLQVILFCLMLLCTLNLTSQALTLNLIPYLNAAPSFQAPEEELELLPDTSSYYVEEELYNADTLTRKGIILNFRNYGSTRYAVHSSVEEYSLYQTIIHFQRINDTFALQTTTNLNFYNGHIDSTLVWYKDGLISHALMVRNQGKNRLNYTFEYDKGKLIHSTLHSANIGVSDTKYTYADDRLVKMVYHCLDYETETDFQYTDSLITMTSIERGDSSVNYIKSLTRLDEKGRKLSVKTYWKLHRHPDLRLYQSEEYTYYNDRYYTMTATQHDQDNVCTVEYHLGWGLGEERWTWKGSDQVWVKNRFPM